jgi:hypothetical protein
VAARAQRRERVAGEDLDAGVLRHAAREVEEIGAADRRRPAVPDRVVLHEAGLRLARFHAGAERRALDAPRLAGDRLGIREVVVLRG